MRFLYATLAIFLMGLELKAQPKLANAIEAIVHDSVITSFEIDYSIEPALQELARQLRTQPETFQKRREDMRTDARERFLENQLILHEFETAGYSLPESVIDDYVHQRIRSRYRDRATLTKTLQAEGITFEKYRKQTRDQFIIEQMRYKNVSDAVLISPYKIEVYYVAHTNDFKVEDQVKLRLIALNKPVDDAGQIRTLADEILSKINGGASFAEMAKVYSQDSHAGEGGDWGWFETSKLLKELATAAEALKPGERSGVIEVKEACYLLLVEDKRPAHIKPLSEVRNEIEKILLDHEHARLRQQWIDRLKKKTFVRYF
jgi:peptidyl-prolyl cis-trans isomerase SurA